LFAKVPKNKQKKVIIRYTFTTSATAMFRNKYYKCMARRRFWKLTVTNFFDVSLPYIQKPAAGNYPDEEEHILHPLILLTKGRYSTVRMERYCAEKKDTVLEPTTEIFVSHESPYYFCNHCIFVTYFLPCAPI
jgi:hypothetical protein